MQNFKKTGNGFFQNYDMNNQKWRLVEPNLYCWWFYDKSQKLWCATLHDSHGNLVSEGSYEIDEMDAVIQCVKIGKNL